MVQFGFSTVGAAAQALPVITGSEWVGQTLSLDTSELTNPTAYQWKSDGVDVGGATSATFDTSITGGTQVSCEVTSDEGVSETPSVYVHNTGMAMMNAQVVDLMGHEEASHISISSGNWSSASTWHTGEVPPAGANVLIANGHTVTYDVTAQVRLDRVRVDGHLTFARAANTEMLVETMIGNVEGHIDLGTSFADNITGSAEISISNRVYTTNPNAPTDMSLTRDPTLLGRGILVIGKITSFGINKTSWRRVSVDPAATDTSVTLASAPSNWAVGDEIGIPGTLTIANTNSLTLQDEVRTITGISGNVVSFSGGLSHDHGLSNANSTTTRTDVKIPIVNMTKNIKIRSEDGSVDVWRRGHTMFMHGEAEVDVWDIEFIDLGRTNKAVRTGVIDTDGTFRSSTGNGSNVSITNTTLTAQSNLQSRYPLHFHFCGFNRGASKPLAQNCMVRGTPGWGAVHHGCEADLIEVNVNGFTGAGMVSETGDETGAWLDSVAWGATPASTSDGSLKLNEDSNGAGRYGDFAFSGVAFYFRGRAMRTNRNIAASCHTGHGFFHRDAQAVDSVALPLALERDTLDIGDIANIVDDEISFDKYPIIHHENNESIGTQDGLFITKGNPDQGHGLNVKIKKFQGYGCERGAYVEYVAIYILDNFDIVNRDGGSDGIRVGSNAHHISVVNPTIEGATRGVYIEGTIVDQSHYNNTTDPRTNIVNATYINCTTEVDYLSTTEQNNTRIFATEPTYQDAVLTAPVIMYDFDGNSSTGQTNVQTASVADTVGSFPLPAPNGVASYDVEGQFGFTKLLNRVGYWQYSGGNAVFYPIYVSDRLTGRPLKRMVGFNYTGSTSGKTDNGAFTFSSTAPTRADISTSTSENVSLNIDVLSAATVEAGATAALDDNYVAPQNGTATINGNGTVDYVPDTGWTGDDEMYVFVSDGRGQYATVLITITVS